MILWLHYFHTCECFSHVYNFKYVFNSTVIKFSQQVICYLISKNFYSLQNVQPFIFQLICMQLCKCINCLLKTHNKQLDQYCLNFTFFFSQKKKNLKKRVRVGSQVNPFLLPVKKIRFMSSIFRVGSEFSDSFCHV